MVSTLDFESNNPSSILGMSFFETNKKFDKGISEARIIYLFRKFLIKNNYISVNILMFFLEEV